MNYNKPYSLKFLAKKKIIDLVLKKEISWERIRDTNVLPNELFEYVNRKYKNIICSDLFQGVKVIKLIGHTRQITSLYIDKKAKCIITGSRDMTARIWDMKILKCLVILVHDFVVNKVYLNYKMNLAVTSDSKNRIHFWNAKEGIRIKTLVLNSFVIDISTIDYYGENSIMLRDKNNVHIINPLTLQFVKTIKYYYLTLMTSHIKCETNSMNEVVLTCANGMVVALGDNINEINDIIYVPENGILVSCHSNKIKIWRLINHVNVTTIDIESPLLVRKFKYNSLLIISRFSHNVFVCYEYHIQYCKLILLKNIVLSSISGNYVLMDVEIHIPRNACVILRVYNELSNEIFWVMIDIPMDSTINEHIHVYTSQSKPVIITDDMLFLCYNIKSLNITDLNDNVVNLCINGNIILDNTFQHKKYFIYGDRNGKCIISLISFWISLEQYLFLLEIKKCTKNKIEMNYNSLYNELLVNADANIFTLLVVLYRKILRKYFIECGLEKKSLKKFGKCIEELSYHEICELCGYKSYEICQ
jgi:hypothetical protein